jgi:DNA-binding MarR family transcriptional regulator
LTINALDDIFQRMNKPPPPDLPSMSNLLRHGHAKYGSTIRAALADGGYDDVPEHGLYVIGGLARQRGARPLGDLIAELGMSKQAAGQLVDSLVVRGYLHREPDASDRRKLTVALTDRGRAAARIAGAAHRSLDTKLVALVGEKDVERTRRTLALLVGIGREEP